MIEINNSDLHGVIVMFNRTILRTSFIVIISVFAWILLNIISTFTISGIIIINKVFIISTILMLLCWRSFCEYIWIYGFTLCSAILWIISLYILHVSSKVLMWLVQVVCGAIVVLLKIWLDAKHLKLFSAFCVDGDCIIWLTLHSLERIICLC